MTIIIKEDILDFDNIEKPERKIYFVEMLN